ncbi:hypothetical protein SDC9_13798 [bioreactor metagenome]|uniref:Uncharacterized protein n=1 Tax=bioreactor metagenome TaxID=1076179 RepID=A0A644TM87_9ZZZZ|nr:hypothetical protein [Negativicutes bacterium]
MGFEDRISQLCKKLTHLGYYQYQIKNMMKEASGTSELAEANYIDRAKIVSVLEQYTQLGHAYMVSYSK